jgi:putative membrane protein
MVDVTKDSSDAGVPLDIVIKVLVGLVAFLHVYFLVLEMFLWDKPFGMKTFQRTKEQQTETKVLAANQGLYNGFLAAGLVWTFFLHDTRFIYLIQSFFLGCIVIAGLYGGATVGKKIAFVQALPAFVALICVQLGPQ